MKTEEVVLSRIAENENNPRTISEEKFRKLVKSVLVFPRMLALRPIVVDETMTVLGGNMRLKALRHILEMDADAVRTVIAENDKFTELETANLGSYWDGWRKKPTAIIVKADDLTEEQKREFIIKDNVGFGEWDIDMLANQWDVDVLQDWGLDGWQLGMGADSECEGGQGKPAGQAEDDGYVETEHNIEQHCKRGDVWLLGRHRLMCGDSASSDDVARLMNGKKANMVFTDPPYGVSIGDKNAALNSIQKAGRCCENIENDTLSSEELYPILVKAMTNARISCEDDATYFVTSPQGGELGLMMMMMMKNAGLPVRHILIWVKNCATFSLGRLDYDYQHEPIFYTWTKRHKNYRQGEYRTTIWEYDKPRKCDLHPTMKPVELVANCMMDGTQEGDIILDVFGGSGTTIIAAEQLDRTAYLMELDPHYCDVIINRWETLTGLKAERAE